MKIAEISQATNDVANTASALVDFARTPQQLDDFAHSLWPKLAVRKDQARWTFYPAGDIKGSRFTVEMP